MRFKQKMKGNSMLEHMIILKQFAKMVGISPEYLSRLIKAGKVVPRETATGRKYFLEEDVEAFLNGKKNND